MKVTHLLAFSAILSYLAEALYAPFYAVFVENIGGSITEAGLAWGIYMSMLGVFTFMAARLAEKLRRHAWILYTGFFLAGLLSLSYLFVSNVIHLYIVQFLMGLVWAAVNPVWDAYYSLFLPPKRPVAEWSLFEGGSRIATGLGATIGGFLIPLCGFKCLFVLAALLNFVASLILFTKREELSIVY